MNVYRENKRIADSLNSVENRTTSNFTTITENSPKKPMDANRKRKLMQLNHDNLHLLNRLENVKSCYDSAAIHKQRQ